MVFLKLSKRLFIIIYVMSLIALQQSVCLNFDPIDETTPFFLSKPGYFCNHFVAIWCVLAIFILTMYLPIYRNIDNIENFVKNNRNRISATLIIVLNFILAAGLFGSFLRDIAISLFLSLVALLIVLSVSLLFKKRGRTILACWHLAICGLSGMALSIIIMLFVLLMLILASCML